MSIYTNGNKVAYLDAMLNAGVVFCTQQGKVTAVCSSLPEAINVVERGLQWCIRDREGDMKFQQVYHGHNKQIRDEFVRKAASKYPMAYIF